MPLKNGDFVMVINLVFCAAMLILLLCIIVGGVKGFFKSCLSLVAFVLSGTIVIALNPFVTGFLRNNTKLDEWIESKVEKMITGFEETEGDTVVLNQEVTLPVDVELSDGTYLPAGTTVPAGTVLPSGIGFDDLKEQANEQLSAAEQSKIIENLPIPEALRNSLE